MRLSSQSPCHHRRMGNKIYTMTTEPMIERQWLPAHIAGDPDAFPALMKAYKGPIYSFLMRCQVNDLVRDDLFQEIFIKVHQNAQSYDPGRALKPWIFTIVVNTVRSHFRKKTPQGPVAVDILADDAPSSQQIVEANETQRWLTKQLKSLPDPQRDVVLLHCFQKLTTVQIADILHKPLGTVKTHLRRGRQALIQAFSRREPRTGGRS